MVIHFKKENLKEFHILRAEDSSFQKIASVTKDESSYTDVNFKTGALYKYKVVAGSLKKSSATIQIYS